MTDAPPSPLPARDDERYHELIAREARHWGAGAPDPLYPQLWDDPRLFELTLAPAYRHLVDRAARHARVLEFGCGDGDLALELAARGPHVTGLDLSPERVARAEAQAREKGFAARTAFRTADLNTVELPAASFDCVVAHDALHHVLDLDHLLAAAESTLVPGGVLLVSDFIGAGRFEKLVSAGLYAVLPTLQPYGAKWSLRHRLRGFLASEERKRQALARGETAELHEASPFEGISQRSIVEKIAARFEVVERFTYCPYWYHLVPKLRLPRAARAALLGGARRIDEPLNRSGWTSGSYAFVEARRR